MCTLLEFSFYSVRFEKKKRNSEVKGGVFNDVALDTSVLEPLDFKPSEDVHLKVHYIITRFWFYLLISDHLESTLAFLSHDLVDFLRSRIGVFLPVLFHIEGESGGVIARSTNGPITQLLDNTLRCVVSSPPCRKHD